MTGLSSIVNSSYKVEARQIDSNLQRERHGYVTDTFIIDLSSPAYLSLQQVRKQQNPVIARD